MCYKNNELYHYGVLGMKWGVHRAKKNVQKAKNRRDSAKEWDEIAKYAKAKGKTRKAEKYKRYAAEDRIAAERYKDKANKIRKKHESRTSKATVKRVEKMSTGKAVVQSMLLGTYGALKYNQAKASNLTTGESVVAGVAGATLSSLTGGIWEIAEPRVTARRKQNRR